MKEVKIYMYNGEKILIIQKNTKRRILGFKKNAFYLSMLLRSFLLTV